jgi:hypothetical protein
MSQDHSILIVAFDGLDKRYIDRYDLENLQQDEYGSIDNVTDVEKIMTPELFASFATGEPTWEHGIRERGKWNSSFLNKYEKYLNPLNLMTIKRFLRSLPWFAKDGVTLEDHESETLFDVFDSSEALFVPTVSPSITQKVNWEHAAAVRNPVLDMDDALEMIEREFLWRKKRLFEEIENGHDLLMCHLFYPDHLQHHYQDEKMPEDRKKVLYQRMDDLAATIQEKAAGKYDYIVFMSDHGFAKTDGEGHNEHAFYSSNKPLFPDREPRIVDFFDVLVQKGNTDSISNGIDI